MKLQICTIVFNYFESGTQESDMLHMSNVTITQNINFKMHLQWAHRKIVRLVRFRSTKYGK